MAVTVFEVEDLHQKWEKLKDEMAQHEQLEESLATNIRTREGEIQTLRSHIQQIDEQLDSLHKNYYM